MSTCIDPSYRCANMNFTGKSLETCGRRNGVATMWIIVAVLVAVLMLCISIEIGNLWLARVQLQASLEAAALAAVDQWAEAGGGGTATLAHRDRGVTLSGANTVSGIPTVIGTNYSATAANGNLSASGNLIFGAITSTMPTTIFDANAAGGCGPDATVFFQIDKNLAGNGVTADEILVRYDAAPATLEVRTIKFTIPVFGSASKSQHPFFDSDKNPEVSIVGGDSQGIDVDPRGAASLPASIANTWWCSPHPFTGGGFSNPDGDICFEMENQIPPGGSVGTNRYRTVIIELRPGSFTSTNNIATTDFFKFGVSTNQLNPPVLPGSNDGEAWRKTPISVEVTFYDTATMMTQTATTNFVDDGNTTNGIAEATISGANGGSLAVFAQATVSVPTICGSAVGIGAFNVSASTYAQYDCSAGEPSLILVDQMIGP